MNKGIRLLLAFVLLSLLALVFFMRPSARVTTKDSEPLLLFIGGYSNDVLHPISLESGSLIDGTRGYIATAKHVVKKLEENESFELYLRLNGEIILLEKTWEHSTADLAIVRIKDLPLPTMLPVPYVVEKKLPKAGAGIEMRGHAFHSEKLTGTKCEQVQKKFFCDKRLKFSVYLSNAPMYAISPETDIEQLATLATTKRRHPNRNLAYEDLFFDRHIVVNASNTFKKSNFEGISGGVVTDEAGHLIGVPIGGIVNYGLVLIVPASEIPDRFLPNPR